MIDKEALELLDVESVKEMVVSIGPRRKLLKKLEEEKVHTKYNIYFSTTKNGLHLFQVQ